MTWYPLRFIEGDSPSSATIPLSALVEKATTSPTRKRVEATREVVEMCIRVAAGDPRVDWLDDGQRERLLSWTAQLGAPGELFALLAKLNTAARVWRYDERVDVTDIVREYLYPKTD